MAFNLEEVTQKLLAHPYFEKTKHIKELGPGHPENSVFLHLTQTADVIKQRLNGEFIQNPDARKLFLDFVNRNIEGNLYKDIAIVTGFIHDIGKILSYREEENIFPINQLKPGTDSSQSIDHGYYGSLIVDKLLHDSGITGKIINDITDVIRLHLIPFDYYAKVANLPIRAIIDDLKPRMQGKHIAVCLNALGDIDNNSPLAPCKELLYKMFEEPHFYSTREYFVA